MDVPRPESEPVTGGGSPPILLNAGFRAIADVGSKLATALLYLLVARKTGAAQFGVFTFALSFAGIAVTLGYFGQEVLLAREVSRDHGKLDAYYSNVLTSKLVLSLPPLLGAVAVGSALGMSSHTLMVVLLMGLGFIFDCVIGVSFAVFIAYERVSLIPVVLIAQRWLTTLVATTVLLLGAGILAVAAIYCTGALLAAIFAAWLLFHRIAKPHLHVDLRAAMAVARDAAPVGLGIVALLLLTRIDTTMLAIFSSSSEVGQYGAAYRLLETTAFVTWSVNTAVLPAMSRLTPTTTPPVGFLYQRAIKLVLALTVPAAAGAAILATPIIALLYGPEFHRAAGALALLSPTIMLFPISSLSCQLFYSQDVRHVVVRVYAAVLLENIVWNLIMIPRFSLYGAAAGTSVSELLVAGTLLFFSRGLHGSMNIRRILAGVLLGTAAASAPMALFSDSLLLAIPLGVVTYFAIFLTFERIAFPDDFAVITGLIARVKGSGPLPPPASQPN